MHLFIQRRHVTRFFIILPTLPISVIFLRAGLFPFSLLAQSIYQLVWTSCLDSYRSKHLFTYQFRKTVGTSVRAILGSTESFEVNVGLHQGSALSPLLFMTVMDVISQEVGRGPPHAMLFVDDLVLCEITRKQAEVQLELWRNSIENKGLVFSRSKT